MFNLNKDIRTLKKTNTSLQASYKFTIIQQLENKDRPTPYPAFISQKEISKKIRETARKINQHPSRCSPQYRRTIYIVPINRKKDHNNKSSERFT